MSYQGSITIVDLADGESSGINTANIYLYQRSSDTPTGPTGTLRYTFATHALSGSTADFNGWKQSMDDLSGTDPIWIIAATALANTTETYDDVTYDEWSNPIKMAENGDDGAPGAPGAPGQEGAPGINQATIFLYTRSADPPQSKPASVIYTFADGSFTAPTGWSKTVPQNDGNPCWVTTGAAIGSGATATIAQNKWADIQKLVEDGINGTSPTVVQTDAGVEIIDANGNKTYVNNGVNGQSYYTYIYYSSKQNPTAETDVSSSPGGKEYVGIQTTTSNNPPAWNDPNWNWTKYIGSDGASATTYYAYVKYATDSSGSNMRDNPGTGYDYVGTYTGTVQTPAANLYKWSKYTGDPGQPATPYYAYIKYATDSSGTDMQDSPDNTHIYVGTYTGAAQAPAANLYQWSRYIGADGVSVTEVKEIYCLTNTTPPTLTPGTPITSISTGTGIWTTVVPTYVSGYTYYTSVQTSLSQGTSPIFSTPIQNQGLTSANSNAATAKAATDLLGGHFIYKGSSSGQSTPSGAGVIQQINDDPAEWEYNTWIGSNGIKLRHGETTLSKWDTDSLIFYKPKNVLMARVKEKTFPHNVSVDSETFLSKIDTIGDYQFIFHQGSQWTYNEEEVEIEDYGMAFTAVDGASTAEGQYITIEVYNTNVQEKGIQLSSTGLEIFGSSQSTADVTVNSSGIKLIKGGIEAGSKNTTDYIYVWSNDDSNHSITIGNSTAKTDWRIIAGNKFGVDKAGNVYATNANITGTIKANEGSIGGANGWTISSQEIKSTDYDITDSGSIYLSTKDLTTAKTINGQSRTDWRFTIGDKFGVTSAGYLYADGFNITNIDTSSITVGPVIYYGVCSTAQSTKIKEVTIDRFQLVQGATVVITFVNGNSNSAPSLKINDGNAIAIKAYDGTSLSSYEYSFTQSNVSRTFTYNGTYWLLQDSGAGDARSSASSAAYTAYDYITKIDNAGIFISPYNQSPSASSPGNSVKIDGSGMIVYNGGVAIAQYGTTAIIGQVANGKSRVEITEKGVDFYNRTSNQDVTLAHIGYDTGKDQNGSTTNFKYPYYTFGNRRNDTSATRGIYSVVVGHDVTAEGYVSYAEGTNGYAIGDVSHAEGNGCRAVGEYSHAEGISSSTQGEASHAEGAGATTWGDYAHAQNEMTTAMGKAQTVIGTCNRSDASTSTTHPSGDTAYRTFAFIIGNGTENAVSNALTVDWTGNITVANHSSHIGDVKSHAPSAVSCANKKYYQLAYLTLDPGVWLIDACGAFPNTNTTGMRQIRVSTAIGDYDNVSDAPQAVGNIAIDARPAVGAYLYPNVHFPVKITSRTTYRVIGYQSSGGTVSVSGRIYATRIQ